MVTVLGDGAMGTVCALLLWGNGHRVRLWGAFADDIALIRKTRRNRRLLADVDIPQGIELSDDDRTCLVDADLAVLAVPTQHLRSVCTRLKGHMPERLDLVSVAKGIEIATSLRPSEIITQALGGQMGSLAVLSGPNIAGEIARGLPATAVVASADAALALRVQELFSGPTFRVYSNNDVIGVELAGAVKNVIALAAGIVDGLGLGSNAKSALLTRGLVEITRLSVAMGAQGHTFSGLAGLGDLVTTCISPEGRNRRVGEALGKGQTLEQILASMPSVAEGVPTTKAVLELAGARGIEMPICQAVGSILFDHVHPADALAMLMSREIKAE